MKKSRREEEQEQRQRQVNPVAAALGGLILGMLSGVAFAGWEVAMLGWFGAGAPHETGLALSVSLFAVAGGFVGALAGITGLNEGKWAVAASLLTFAFLLSGKAAGWTSASVPTPSNHNGQAAGPRRKTPRAAHGRSAEGSA